MAGYDKQEWFLLLIEGLGRSHPGWEGTLEEVWFGESQFVCGLGDAVVGWEDDVAAGVEAVGQGGYIHRKLLGEVEALF